LLGWERLRKRRIFSHGDINKTGQGFSPGWLLREQIIEMRRSQFCEHFAKASVDQLGIR